MSETYTTPEPRILERLSPPTHRKYPWETWADGAVREFLKGTHFEGRIETFRKCAHNWGEANGYTVNTRVRGDRCEVQFVAQMRGAPGRAKST